MKDIHHVQQSPSGQAPAPLRGIATMRPTHVKPVTLKRIAAIAGARGLEAGVERTVSGVTSDSRSVVPGDLYIALPGAHVHGHQFGAAAVAAGAVAILTDDAGAQAVATYVDVPVLSCPDPRGAAGEIAALVYGTAASTGPGGVELFAVTGTNGKTTTTYFLNSLLRALGNSTGLIGTIEILAGDEPIPSKLTTPESTDVHALLAVMAERGLDAASMEVSSHALAFGRVDGVVFDVAGFTNLTQDHLDLHGDMDAYFATKAELFTAGHSRAAVVTIDDVWGRKMAAKATIPVSTLRTAEKSATGSSGATLEFSGADWKVSGTRRQGIGSAFELHGRGMVLGVHTGLPGGFNVSNAALALAMVADALLENIHTLDAAQLAAKLQDALDRDDPFTVDVPGRMQLVGTAPVAVVDFAHNPDALERALDAVRSPVEGSRVIVVFGATGERDQSKRPIMGAIAALHADVVLITDDDPHDEDPAAIRAGVLAGAIEACERNGLSTVIEESTSRAEAIGRAVELAGPADTILVAGRGHEVFQEVRGVNISLDDRVELRAALTHHGFPVTNASTIRS